jgi:DNA-binding XRE family transcriptional regulator
MFPNLEAEQRRKNLNNADMAKLLGVSRNSFETKKKTGKFWREEIIKLCGFFDKGFEYLFATEDEQPKKAG